MCASALSIGRSGTRSNPANVLSNSKIRKTAPPIPQCAHDEGGDRCGVTRRVQAEAREYRRNPDHHHAQDDGLHSWLRLLDHQPSLVQQGTGGLQRLLLQPALPGVGPTTVSPGFGQRSCKGRMVWRRSSARVRAVVSQGAVQQDQVCGIVLHLAVDRLRRAVWRSQSTSPARAMPGPGACRCRA